MRWVHHSWSDEDVFTFRDAYSSSFIKRLRVAVLEVMEMVIIRVINLLRLFNMSSIAGLQAGAIIGLPPVLNFGSPELKARVIPEVLSGKKFICLAISEAFAGSDVMGLKTTAKKSEDGKHWIINGTKKWITNGQYVETLHCYRSASERTESDSFADYFTVGCKTDNGFTVILVERGEGVETSSIKTSYSPAAGTAYITFDDVKVPVGNTLGSEGGGVFVMLR